MSIVPLPDGLRRLPIAHRALHNRAAGIIENSPSAIDAAIKAGYAIEIDLQLSKDGQAMVFHDETLERLTEKSGWVDDYTAAELGELTHKGGSDKIPTLEAVLRQIDGQVPLLIELKDQSLQMGETDGRLEAETARLLAGYRGEVAVMSFNPHSIALMAEHAPQIARGLTTSSYDYADWDPLPKETCDRLREIPDYDRTQSSFISHEAPDLSRPRVLELKAKGAAVLCWTIKSPEAEREARKIAENVTFEQYLAELPKG